MTPLIFLGLMLAGAIGAPARYVLEVFVQSRSRGVFPWGTFIINVSGSLFLGVITGAALYHGFPKTSKLLLGTGFCGAYTTFSTFSFETVRLIEDDAYAEALFNVGSTVLVCAAGAALGLALAAL